MRKDLCGIYAITNLNNGKIYIGSSVRIRGRWAWHRSSLRLGKHHSRMLQRSFDKHGADAFEYAIIEECEAAALHERETFHMARLGTCDPVKGYNTLPIAGSARGWTPSEETRERMSAGQRRIPKEKRLEYCRSFVGRKHTPETRARMAEVARRRWECPEARKRQSAKLMGHEVTDETRAKMRAGIAKRRATLTG